MGRPNVSAPTTPRPLPRAAKKPPLQRPPLGDRLHPGQQRFVAVARDAIAHQIDDDRPPRPITSIREAAVERQRVVEHGRPRRQLARHGSLHRRPLLGRQDRGDPLHSPGQHSHRQQRPPVRPRHVMDAAVRGRRVVEPDPAGEVGQRLGAGPVRVILVPRDDAPVPRRFAEELVVPEPHRPLQQLRRGDHQALRSTAGRASPAAIASVAHERGPCRRRSIRSNGTRTTARGPRGPASQTRRVRNAMRRSARRRAASPRVKSRRGGTA